VERSENGTYKNFTFLRNHFEVQSSKVQESVLLNENYRSLKVESFIILTRALRNESGSTYIAIQEAKHGSPMI
jgi:hypothetical protein